MNGSLAGDCRVYLFEGTREDVQRRANEFLTMQKDNAAVRLMEVVFNYQGPEYDGRLPIPDSATFGLGLVFQYGLPPVAEYDSPLKHILAGGRVTPACSVTPEMLFTVMQAANPLPRPTTHLGRAWQRFAGRFL